jgi:hypothetical protein
VSSQNTHLIVTPSAHRRPSSRRDTSGARPFVTSSMHRWTSIG